MTLGHINEIDKPKLIYVERDRRAITTDEIEIQGNTGDNFEKIYSNKLECLSTYYLPKLNWKHIKNINTSKINEIEAIIKLSNKEKQTRCFTAEFYLIFTKELIQIFLKLFH